VLQNRSGSQPQTQGAAGRKDAGDARLRRDLDVLVELAVFDAAERVLPTGLRKVHLRGFHTSPAARSSSAILSLVIFSIACIARLDRPVSASASS